MGSVLYPGTGVFHKCCLLLCLLFPPPFSILSMLLFFLASFFFLLLFFFLGFFFFRFGFFLLVLLEPHLPHSPFSLPKRSQTNVKFEIQSYRCFVGSFMLLTY